MNEFDLDLEKSEKYKEEIDEYKRDVLYFHKERTLENYVDIYKALEFPEFRELKIAYNALLVAKLAIDKAVDNL